MEQIVSPGLIIVALAAWLVGMVSAIAAWRHRDWDAPILDTMFRPWRAYKPAGRPHMRRFAIAMAVFISASMLRVLIPTLVGG